MDSVIQEKLDKDEKVLAESEKAKKRLRVYIINVVSCVLTILISTILSVISTLSFLRTFFLMVVVSFSLVFIPMLITFIVVICQYCSVAVVITNKRVFARSGITSPMEELPVADINKMIKGVGFNYGMGVSSTLTIICKDKKKKIAGLSNVDELCAAFQEAKIAWLENEAKGEVFEVFPNHVEAVPAPPVSGSNTEGEL